MWILRGTCHDRGHDWKDGHTVGQVVFAYTSMLPPPYAPDQHPRVGTFRSVITPEHFTLDRASILEVLRLAPKVFGDLKSNWRRVFGLREKSIFDKYS